MRRESPARRYGGGWLLAIGGALWGLAAGAAPAQDTGADAALRDRVLQLVEKLEDPKPEAREEAQARLIKLGAKVLPLLPDAASVTGKERKERIGKVVAALRQNDEESRTGPSKVTIQARGIRLTEALQQLQKQTGNAVSDAREELGAEATNPALDLDLRDVPFLEALDRIARQAEVSTNAASGDGSINIVAGAPPKSPLLRYIGPFRVAFRQITEVRDLQAGSAAASAQFEVTWEPRLRPMLLALKMEDMAIKDDKGRDIKPQSSMESTDVVLRPENPTAEININLDAPERLATKISVFRVKSEITLPAGIKTFRFPDLSKENVVLKQGDVSATLRSLEIDEQVWKVNLEVSYTETGPAFESYREGLFNNRVWLQKADGTRFEHNGGFSNTGSDGGRLGFEYLFVDAPGKPGDYQLVYETPSRVIKVPLEFEFKDVPLP